MSTIRVSKDSNYSCINNQPIRNTELTWAARGLLIFLLSMPDDWTANVEHLTTQGPSGRDHIYSLLKELEIGGYLTRTKKKDDRGRWEWEHLLHETPRYPEIPNESPSTAKPDLDKPEIKEVLNYQVLKETPLPPEPEPAPSPRHNANGRKPPNDPGALNEIEPPYQTETFREAWADFVEHRRQIKKPLTPLAVKRMFITLRKWGESRAVQSLHDSVQNGWQGIFEPTNGHFPANPNLPGRDANGRAKLVI